MSSILFKGNEDKGGIPRKSKVRVESLPHRSPVFVGEVSESIHLDLDPGKYIASVSRLSDPRKYDDCDYVTEFYHELGDEAWKQIQALTPRFCRTINTTEGPRYRCQICREVESTSVVGALLHEIVDHIGVPREKFLANPMGREVKAAVMKGVELGKAMVVEPERRIAMQVADED